MTDPSPPSARLLSQLDFVLEIDRLKGVLRQTLLTDGSRRENSAEHSWHIAVMALLLQEYAAEPIDPLRVATMLLIHDIVEIDAGDTFCYDTAGHADKAERETAAAERIFGLLPADQGATFRTYWEEFEARSSPDARFAAALDRMQPLLHNLQTEGAAWQRHGITVDQVLSRNAHMAEGAPALWAYTEAMIHDAVARGWLAPAP